MNLQELQREMAAAVMQPLTSDESMQESDTIGRWQGRAMDEVASEFIRPNDRLTSFERLEIYNRQYWFRLQNAFAEDFPALHSVVGSSRFEVLANAYLTAHPSRSFTLRNLGSHLHAWLSENPSYAGRRVALALDVVSIEWACIEAFDNAELLPLSPADAAGIGAESRLRLQPHLQLLALNYPADELVLEMHRNQKRESTEAGARQNDTGMEETVEPLRLNKRPTWLAIHRSDYSLYYRRLSKGEFLTLSALRRGLTLSQAIDAGFERSRVSISNRARLLQQWFANWAELGWICAPEPELEVQKRQG
jgi:hypothetical protein